jgi:hypothetical protein
LIKHIVFWRLKDSAHGNDKGTNARLIKEACCERRAVDYEA